MAFTIPAVQHTQAKRGGPGDMKEYGRSIGEGVKKIRVRQLEKKRDQLLQAGPPTPATQAELDKLDRVIGRLKHGSDEAAAEAKRQEEMQQLQLEGARTEVEGARLRVETGQHALGEAKKEAEHREVVRPLEVAAMRRGEKLDDMQMEEYGLKIGALRTELAETKRRFAKMEEADITTAQVNTLEDLLTRPEVAANKFLREGIGEVLDMRVKLAKLEDAGAIKPGSGEKYAKSVAAGWMVFMGELSQPLSQMGRLAPDQRYQYMERMLNGMAAKAQEQPEMQSAFQKIYDAWLMADRGGEGGQGDQVITDAEYDAFLNTLGNLEAVGMMLLKLTKDGGSDVRIPGFEALGGGGGGAQGIINRIPRLGGQTGLPAGAGSAEQQESELLRSIRDASD